MLGPLDYFTIILMSKRATKTHGQWTMDVFYRVGFIPLHKISPMQSRFAFFLFCLLPILCFYSTCRKGHNAQLLLTPKWKLFPLGLRCAKLLVKHSTVWEPFLLCASIEFIRLTTTVDQSLTFANTVQLRPSLLGFKIVTNFEHLFCSSQTKIWYDRRDFRPIFGLQVTKV
jgi:hypothetical protein